MTTPTQTKEILAPLLRMHEATFNRYQANVAEAKLIRQSGHGGGKAAIHYSAFEYALLVLSFASPTPSGAGAAAKALGGLFPELVEAGVGSLATGLAAAIETYALQIRRGTEDDVDNEDWELTLCLDPLSAWMSWPTRGANAKRRFFYNYLDAKTVLPAVGDPPVVRRETILTKPLLMAVAKLYAD